MRGRTDILASIFRQGETGYFHSGQTLIEAGKLPRYVYQLRTGLAYQSHRLPDGRRAIVDLFTPGNVVGLETILSLRASATVTAAGPVKYLALDPNSLHRLMEDRQVALCFTSLLIEAFRGIGCSDRALRSAGAGRRDVDRPPRPAAAPQVDRPLIIQPAFDAAANRRSSRPHRRTCQPRAALVFSRRHCVGQPIRRDYP